MALFRCSSGGGGGGGGSTLDLMHPDKKFTATLSANASTSFTCTQKPRWICVLMTSGNVGYYFVFDCENETSYYWRSSSTYAEDSALFSDRITAISNTGFTFRSRASGTSYNTFFVFY